MPRVYQALARAQSERQARVGEAGPAAADVTQRSSAGSSGPGLAPEVAQAPVGPPLAPWLQEPQITGNDIVSLVSATQAAGQRLCPHCDAFSDSQLPPAFLRWSYRLTRKPMHLCGACGRRYHTPKLSRPERPMPAFLPPSNGRGFNDLVRDMARDERDWKLSEQLKRSR